MTERQCRTLYRGGWILTLALVTAVGLLSGRSDIACIVVWAIASWCVIWFYRHGDPAATAARQDQIRRLQADVSELKAELCHAGKELTLIKQESTDLTKKAAASNEAKSNFLATMSHEIRTPMNSIIGFSDLMLSEPLTSEQAEYLDMIRENSRHLLHIINEILDYSKIERGKLGFEYLTICLFDLLKEVRDIVSVLAEQKHLDFQIIAHSGVAATFTTDPLRLKQCLLNLLTNSIKYTGRGHVRLEVKAQQAPDKQLLFYVHDSGIGIPPDCYDKVFESFHQGDSSTTRKYGGTGLGLPITKSLVERMGGTIHFSSEVNVGTTFCITLPCDPPEELLTGTDPANEQQDCLSQTS